MYLERRSSAVILMRMFIDSTAESFLTMNLILKHNVMGHIQGKQDKKRHKPALPALCVSKE